MSMKLCIHFDNKRFKRNKELNETLKVIFINFYHVVFEIETSKFSVYNPANSPKGDFQKKGVSVFTKNENEISRKSENFMNLFIFLFLILLLVPQTTFMNSLKK